MDIITQLKLFTMFSDGAMVGGEMLAYYLRHYVHKVDKLANGHLAKRKEIENILNDDGLILAKDVQLKKKFNYEGSVSFGATGTKYFCVFRVGKKYKNLGMIKAFEKHMERDMIVPNANTEMSKYNKPL